MNQVTLFGAGRGRGRVVNLPSTSTIPIPLAPSGSAITMAMANLDFNVNATHPDPPELKPVPSKIKPKKLAKKNVVQWIQPLSASGERRSFRHGSEVQLHLTNNEHYRGIIHQNPIDTRDGSFRLIMASQVNERGKRISTERVGITKFPQKDVVQVYVYRKGKIAENPPIALVMKTFTLRSKGELKAVLKVFKDTGTKEVAVKMFFEGLPSEGQLIWLVLCAQDSLFPIDMSKSLQDKEVWDLLKSEIFEKSNVVKIFHDSILELSFLYHTKGIDVKNHYDTKTGVYFMESRSRILLKQEQDNKTDDGLSLVDCLKRYLNKNVLAPELDLLEKWEKYRFLPTDRSIPSVHIQKYISVTVKYLGSLKLVIENSLLQNLYSSMHHQVEFIVSSTRAESNCMTKLPEEFWNSVDELAKPDKFPDK